MRIRQATLADAPAIARIHMDSWRNTYRGMVSDEYLDNLKFEDRLARWQQRMVQEGFFTCVAEVEPEGGVVGFAFAGPEGTGNSDYTGELWALHIAGPHQRSGVGRRLTSEVAKRLHSAGFNSILIWVLKENHPARLFYEQLGGILVDERIEDFAGGRIEEVAYGWSDVTDLMVDEE